MWGLVMAKARHTFQLSDIIERKELKSKYYKICIMALMVAFAQFLKLSADHNLVKNAIEEIESELDDKIQSRFSTSAHKRPMV